MWQLLVLILLTLLLTKFWRVYFFWSGKGIKYENYLRYLYRMFIKIHTMPTFELARQDVKTYGRIYGTYRGMTPSLVVAEVEIAKEVLIKQFGNFFRRSFEFSSGDPLWDNGITHLPYEQWKSVRTVMGYTFTSAKMKSMIPKLDKVAKRLTSKLEAIASSSDNQIVLKPYLKGYAMDSIASISFGLDLNCIDDPESKFVKYAGEIFKPGLQTIFVMLAPNLIKYIPFMHFPNKEATQFFGELGRHVLGEKRKKLDEVIKNNTADIIDYHLIAQRADPKSGLTDEVLASQAFIFFIAGLDVTVAALQYVTYYLAINPEIQDRVLQDIKSVVGNRTDVSYDDLQKLPLLEACTLEALRITPSAFQIDRVCNEETVLAGITVHKGMVVEFASSYMHQDPQYFPEPEKFKPERFLKGDVTSEASAFHTFGDGPKNCVGRRLALMNISVILANMLLKMQFEKTEKTPIPLTFKDGYLSGEEKDPIFIKISPRC